MEYIIFNLVTYFVIYSIAGWVLESVYKSFCERKLINTGFLYGPFCPIYGVGAIIMLMFLKQFQEKILILFLISLFVLSFWEYIVGVFLEKVFKTKYWDYSNHKINIKGRVCLFNSICWGILGVLFIRYIHPYIEKNINLVNPYALKIFICIIAVVLLIDAIVSIIKTKNISNALQRVEELNNQIKDKLEEIKSLNNKNLKTDLVDTLQNRIGVLKKQKSRLFRNLYRRVYRLKKAFPGIQSNEITEILNRRIEIIKKEKSIVKIKDKEKTDKKENDRNS